MLSQSDNKVSRKYVEYIECVQKWTVFNVNINNVHSETNLYDWVRVIVPGNLQVIIINPVN